LPVQCVGAWAKDKHLYVAKYIEATQAVRKKYLSPIGQGGAAYIDLFGGPGMALVRESEELIFGSPLVALEHREAPFTKLIFCDIDEENVNTLRARTDRDRDRVEIIHGNCNEVAKQVLALVPEYGLNIALIDPFAPSALDWATLEKLGERRRMDFIVNFHTGAIKRNLRKPSYHAVIDRVVGDTSWRDVVGQTRDVIKLIDFMKARLERLGYQNETANSYAIRNGKRALMYHLIYATKHPLGNKIWDSIGRNEPGGQRSLGF
jgi:three-Cys-motif partner protein